MMKCPFFTDAFTPAAPISDFVSLRFPPLHHSLHDDTDSFIMRILLSKASALFLKENIIFANCRAKWRSSEQLPLPICWRPICWRPDRNSGGFCSCRHISGSRSNQGGDRQTPQLRRRSNSGSESTSPARAESNPRQGGGSLGAQEYACRCLLALWLWQVIANRLCLVSTDTYGGCWHVDRWVPRWPPGLPLMASTRMDGLIFKVLLVASHSHRDAFTDSSTWADHVLEDNLFVHQTQKSWWLATIT